MLRAIQVVRALERAGFVLVRTTGSHKILDHRDNPALTVTVPDHGSRNMKRGTLRAIIRQAGLTPEEFKELL